jgi:hypothetical protein
MSRSSLEAHRGNRAAGNFILVLLAVLLAVLSTTMGAGFERSAPQQQRAIQSEAAAETEAASAPRGLFFVEPASSTERRYNPAFETSNSAGALGFWILVSLLSLLLGAAAAPSLIHKLRKHD